MSPFNIIKYVSKLIDVFTLKMSTLWDASSSWFIKFYTTQKLEFIGSLIITGAILHFIITKRGDSRDKILYGICSKIELIFKEKTDTPIMKRKGVQKTDKAGKKLFKIQEHVPEFDFSDLPRSFKILKVHKSVIPNLINYHNGLLNLLKEKGYIEQDSGSIQPLGFPGAFIVNLHDRKKLEEMAMFREINWFKIEIINGIKKEYYPEVVIKETEVFLKFPEELKINDDFIHKGLETFEKHFKIKVKTAFTRSQDGSHLFFSYQKPVDRFFKKGVPIAHVFETWEREIIGPMREFWDKHKKEILFLGELEDPNITLPKGQIFVDIASAPHFLTYGQTRSGKTKTNLSIIMTLSMAYPRSKFLFADGKGSPDYDSVAEMLSDYPVAKLDAGDDPLVDLANIISITVKEYDKRRAILESVDKSKYICQNYIDYNKFIESRSDLTEEEKEDLYLRRYFVFIDEFAEFIGQVNVEKLIATKGTIFWAIAKLLRAAASVGITLAISSQRFQNTDFPTRIRSNLTTWLAHLVSAPDAQRAGLEVENKGLTPGSYILKAPGIRCEETKNDHIKASSPFIGEGSDFMELVRLMGKKSGRKLKSFDKEIIYNQGDDDKLEKASPPYLQKIIKQALLKREGFELLYTGNPETDYISIVAKDVHGKIFGVGIVDGGEIGSGFAERLKLSKTPYFNECYKIFFIRGKGGDLLEKEVYLDSVFQGVKLLDSTDYIRPLKKALILYEKGSKEKVFSDLVRIKDQDEGSDPEILYKNDDELDPIINKKSLQEIINLEDTAKKGDAFEKWYNIFERKKGYKTVPARSLIKDGTIPDIFATKRAEGGFDLIRWVDYDKKIAIGIQCKNQISKALNTEVIDKTIKAKELYSASGVQIIETLIVTTGNFTKQAKDEAETLGVKVIDGEKLGQMIDEFSTEARARDLIDIEFNTIFSKKLDEVKFEDEEDDYDPSVEIEREKEFDEFIKESNRPQTLGEIIDIDMDDAEEFFGDDDDDDGIILADDDNESIESTGGGEGVDLFALEEELKRRSRERRAQREVSDVDIRKIKKNL